jgi:hypothetical protein
LNNPVIILGPQAHPQLFPNNLEGTFGLLSETVSPQFTKSFPEGFLGVAEKNLSNRQVPADDPKKPCFRLVILWVEIQNMHAGIYSTFLHAGKKCASMT